MTTNKHKARDFSASLEEWTNNAHPVLAVPVIVAAGYVAAVHLLWRMYRHKFRAVTRIFRPRKIRGRPLIEN